jgi:hypothetical protein
VAGGALQETDAEVRLELLDGVGHRRARQAEILRREREAEPLDHPREDAHRFQSIHLLFVTTG